MVWRIRELARKYLSKWFRGRGAEWQAALAELEHAIQQAYTDGYQAGRRDAEQEKRES